MVKSGPFSLKTRSFTIASAPGRVRDLGLLSGGPGGGRHLCPGAFSALASPQGRMEGRIFPLSISKAQISCGAAICFPKKLSSLNSCLQIFEGLSHGKGVLPSAQRSRGAEKQHWVDIEGNRCPFIPRVSQSYRDPSGGFSGLRASPNSAYFQRYFRGARIPPVLSC